MNQIEVKLFGAFRKYIPSGVLKVQAPDSITAAQMKELIKEVLQKEAPTLSQSDLVHESALATETEVLAEDEWIRNRNNLALLPPVCGG